MKRYIAVILAAVLFLTIPATAADSRLLAADTLYTLGLVEGTNSGYELDRVPTRAEALVFILRLAGLRDEAQAYSGSTPFTDLPTWAEPYICYAYSIGLTSGTDSSHFSPQMQVRDKDFFTMLLRLLGYSESAGDFNWALSGATAVRLGIAEALYTDFDRGDMFECALAALTCPLKDQNITLIDKLVAGGDVERAVANALGLSGARPLTPQEISERYTTSVVYLEGFETASSLVNRTSSTKSTGFFISEDGLLVSNFHTIEGAIYATITTDDGARYPVEKGLYYNPEIDASVLKVSQTPLGGGEQVEFPYLQMMSTDTVHIGDTVYALGNPLGLKNSLSVGIISNNQRVTSGFGLPMLQNTASISQGSSGGALLNEYGYAIGITSGYFTYGKDMYLAVPIDPVLEADLSVEGITLRELVRLMQEQSE